MPKKFFFVPLFIKIGRDVKDEFVDRFAKCVETYDAAELFKNKGLTFFIEENSNGNEN